MAKSSRDWAQIYAIYGLDGWQTPLFLFAHAVVFSILAVLFLLYFEPMCTFLEHQALPGPASARFAAGFAGSVTALSAVCLFYAAVDFLYSAAPLRWEMSQRVVSAVSDWSAVRNALDLGCTGRGMLMNAVALQLKKSGSSGRVVGLNSTRCGPIDPACILRTAGLEGVQKYVTCRPGDPRTLPFSDGYFDVVVSATFLHTVGREFGPGSAAAAAERARVLGEVVRVLRPGGVAVVWDVVHAPEYARRLSEMRMEDVRISERVTAFMAGSHVVSFRKPRQHSVGPGEVRLDWNF
ncbi:S-adenosyl-L-methionine-dependent methyltransferases superfamily protein [Striga hermonthica]|uniref:S-adenosyl-L-methionine-dependent methyltransferases superfamily protein n=1 Tax=Striga hermonthica TaxID=68872 RepID=A0A9N7MYA3_STRHE|nr:S-adenosyl-L-methionine-dependent methyltransferases superfamily protein [Striga hermonthica]